MKKIFSKSDKKKFNYDKKLCASIFFLEGFLNVYPLHNTLELHA